MHTDFQNIAQQAEELSRATTRTNLGHAVLGALLMPLTLGLVVIDPSDRTLSETTAMPDEWLAAVSGLPEISRPGMEFLANVMKTKGWVSVSQALEFVELESAAQAAAVTAAPDVAGAGAAMFLARAEKELPGTIARFAEGAKEFGEAAGGVLSFAAEKAIWAGKGLGWLADEMRGFRSRVNRKS
jgi:hypothetical protein